MADERWQILDMDECRSLLATRHLGRLAFVDAAGPTILPVNYVVQDDLVVFRTDVGGKLEAAMRGLPVAFEIDGIDAGEQSGWSVLVRGCAERVSDHAELARLEELPLIAWAPGAKPHYIRIAAAETTGRRITAQEHPSRWWG